MDVSFDNDEDIKKVVFKADGAFCLKSIKGINIEEITMSGKMLDISSLCQFLDTKNELPNLSQATLTDIGITNFQPYQDCGDDSLNLPLQTTPLETVEVKIICF